MSCTRPIRASFDEAGRISFSKKKWSKQFEPFNLPCRKCIHCRLDTAREKAIRCIHHAQMFPDKNIFLTLTYDDDHLESPRLIYRHWQNFMKELRNEVGYHPDDRISYMVTGEYGDQRKRPHWHAIIFNYSPSDAVFERKTDLGERVFHSASIEKIWSKGRTEFGSVTIESAGYVARYAAKKLIHGRDQDHDFIPVHRTSSRIPIGRPWIEKYWRQTFQQGFVVLPNGSKAGIPRYYEDWFRQQMPNQWMEYASTVKIEQAKLAKQNAEKERAIYEATLEETVYYDKHRVRTRNQVKEKIQELKHESVLKGLKL